MYGIYFFSFLILNKFYVLYLFFKEDKEDYGECNDEYEEDYKYFCYCFEDF